MANYMIANENTNTRLGFMPSRYLARFAAQKLNSSFPEEDCIVHYGEKITKGLHEGTVEVWLEHNAGISRDCITQSRLFLSGMRAMLNHLYGEYIEIGKERIIQIIKDENMQ